MHSSDNQNGPQGTRTGGNDPARAYASSTPPASAYPEAATDFLGLDQDVAAQPHDVQSAAQGEGAPLDTSSSWLLALEDGVAPAANTASTATESPFVAGQATVDAPERMLEPEWQTSAEPEIAANDGTEAPEPEPARRPRSRAPLYALVACAVLATGGWYGWRWWQAQRSGGTPEIAHAPATRPAPAPSKTPAVKTPSVATKTPAPADPNAAATPPAPDTASATTPETASAATTPGFEFGPRTSDARVDEFVRAQRGEGLGGDGLTGPGTPLPDTTALATPGADSLAAAPEDTSFRSPSPTDRTTQRTQGRGTLRIASAGDLAGVWDGNTIPLDAVDKDVKLLTPQIGRVRATIHGGEIFEGRLYAVGQKQFYLDTDLGRMALLATQIAKIEQLSSPDGTATLGAVGSQYLNGLPRVRVRTPGGMLYGKVIGRDDTSLTLITDGGARIRVDATDFEPAPDTNAIIVRGSRRSAP